MSLIEIVSLVVVTIVVVFYGIAFFLSFRKSTDFESRVINAKDMDEEIAEDLLATNKDYFDSLSEEKWDPNRALSLKEFRDRKIIREKRKNLISNIFLGVFYFVIIVILAGGIYVRATGNQIFIGDSTYIIIETGSMASKNEANTWLYDETLAEKYNFDNQIQVFDLIQIEKLKSADDIQLYDVVAYKSASDTIIVHRVYDITTDDKGVKHFRFRGDANNASSSYEYNGHDGSNLGLTFDDFIGRYTGWNSFGLGLAIDYLKSDIGLICLASGIIVVGIFYYYDDKSAKTLARREVFVTNRMDECSDTRYKWYNVNYRMGKSYKKLTKDIFIAKEEYKTLK